MDRIGRYKIIRELGRGAMGVVYHAIDPNIGRPVAIKTISLGAVLKPEEQERMRERLFREARSAGILSHPGIVTIYDVEQQGDLAYIAMEYVDGPTLDHVLSEPQPLEPERLFSILAQTAVALDYAHGKGIVHRDVKPANIMIAPGGTAKITDFGIAKITASEQFTMTGSIVGTPHYMSPEQVQGQPVDGRSDQFSLAVIAYEMLTGEKPYTGEHLTTVVYKIVAEEPPAPHRLNPSLTGAIENVVRKGLSKKPDARYASCQEFVEALEKACAGSKGWQSLPRGGSLNAPTVVDKVLAPPVEKPVLPPSRRSRREEQSASGTTEQTRSKRSGFLPFLAAILMAAGLIAVVAWQVKPDWLANTFGSPSTAGPSAPPFEQPKTPTPAATPTPVPAQTPAVARPADTKPSSSGKPSPVGQVADPTPSSIPAAKPANTEVPGLTPSKSETPADKPARHPNPPAHAAAGPQPVSIVTSPKGAVATLDGDQDSACATPCSIEASSGHHTLVLSKAGYEMKRLDVEVGSSPVEQPAVVLRQVLGPLMVVSDPPGASVLVDGKRQPEVTPARLQLPLGSYTIMVQWKDGKQSSKSVQITDDRIHLEKFVVEK